MDQRAAGGITLIRLFFKAHQDDVVPWSVVLRINLGWLFRLIIENGMDERHFIFAVERQFTGEYFVKYTVRILPRGKPSSVVQTWIRFPLYIGSPPAVPIHRFPRESSHRRSTGKGWSPSFVENVRIERLCEKRLNTNRSRIDRNRMDRGTYNEKSLSAFEALLWKIWDRIISFQPTCNTKRRRNDLCIPCPADNDLSHSREMPKIRHP